MEKEIELLNGEILDKDNKKEKIITAGVNEMFEDDLIKLTRNEKGDNILTVKNKYINVKHSDLCYLVETLKSENNFLTQNIRSLSF